jgi:hypothetical protein
MNDDPARADWIVSYAPASHPCPVLPDVVPVFELASDGVVFAVVYHRAAPGR